MKVADFYKIIGDVNTLLALTKKCKGVSICLSHHEQACWSKSCAWKKSYGQSKMNDQHNNYPCTVFVRLCLCMLHISDLTGYYLLYSWLHVGYLATADEV